MLQLDNPEGLHVGRALEQHMKDLGVTQGLMEQVAGPGSAVEIRWMINANQLGILRIRRFHWWLTEAYDLAPERTEVCVPFREQWFTTPRDRLLYSNVGSTGRRTVWWWGQARTERGAGAYCYVCNTLIHAYDLGRGATHPARLAVMNHRAVHVAESIGVTTTKHGRSRT